MNRPTGVTVLAVLDFLGTGLGVLCAIVSFVGGAFLGSFLAKVASQSGNAAAGAGAGALIGGVLGVMFLFMAMICGVIGFGMWNLKEWGRILQIVFAGIGALFQALGLLVALTHFRVGRMLWNVVWLAVNGWIIFYLIQPQVKAAFGQQNSMQATATGR